MSANTGILGLSARWCTYDLGVLNGIKSSHISGGVRRCLQGKYLIPCQNSAIALCQGMLVVLDVSPIPFFSNENC
jgi:hypothetical protein